MQRLGTASRSPREARRPELVLNTNGVDDVGDQPIPAGEDHELEQLFVVEALRMREASSS